MEKRKMKIISMVLTFILIFNYFVMLSPVLAINSTTEKNQEYLENMLSVIPDEMELGLSEIEYKQAEGEILNKIKDIWENEGIGIEEINIQVIAADLVRGTQLLGIEQLYKANLDLSYNGARVTKEITLKYNNSDMRNKTDEEYVKNLNIEYGYKYLVMDAERISSTNVYEEMQNKLSTYFTNLVNDSSIKIVVDAGQRWRRIYYILCVWMFRSF